MEKCKVMNFKKSSLKCWSTLIDSKLNAAFLSRSPGLHCYWLNENICLLFSCGQNNRGKKNPLDNRLLIRKEENTLEICYWCFSWGYIQYFLFFFVFLFHLHFRGARVEKVKVTEKLDFILVLVKSYHWLQGCNIKAVMRELWGAS